MVGQGKSNTLAVPRIINIMVKITQYKIPGDIINELHFNDLLLLLMSLDIKEIEKAIMLNSKKDRSVKDISPDQAVKFLKG